MLQTAIAGGRDYYHKEKLRKNIGRSKNLKRIEVCEMKNKEKEQLEN